MLVLSRKIGQTIRIGDDVRVRVLGVSGNQVSLGLEAPDDVRILREEIVCAVESQNQRAALREGGCGATLDELWRNDGGTDGR